MEKRYPRFAALYQQWLKEDEEFRRWFESLEAEATRNNYFYKMARLYEATKFVPKEIVVRYRAGGETRQSLLDDLNAYLKTFTQQGKFGIAGLTWAAVTSLLIHRGALVRAADFEVKQPRSDIIPPQYVPTQEEFETMLRYARSARNRFGLAFFRYTGARIGALTDPEPMRLYHVLDLDPEALKRGVVEFATYQYDEQKKTTVRIPRSNSCAVLIYGSVKKGEIVRHRETYIGFLVPQAMQLLKEYLEERLRAGENLTTESYLFAPDRKPHPHRHEHLTAHQMARAVFAISKAAGYKIKVGEETKDGKAKYEPKYGPHSLRRLFYNSLQGLEDVDREALQGHIRGVRARYHGTVDEIKRAIEFMRQKYEFGMRGHIGTASAEEQRKRALLDFARLQGMSDEEINNIQNTLEKTRGFMPTVDDLRDALRKQIEAKKRQTTNKTEREKHKTARNGGTPLSQPFETRIVAEEELVPLLNQGFDVVRELSNGRIVVRKPLDDEEAVSDEQ